MDFSTIKDLYIGSTPVQSAYLNGGKIWGRKLPVDEAAILNSMVLWYDIKRQGATNENMAANPTLRDLSGNGHDATCYNFAWSGMSGIGSYKQHRFLGYTYRRVIANAGGWEPVSDSYDFSVSWKIRVTCPDKPIVKEDGVRLFCPNREDFSVLATLSEPLEDGKVTTISPYAGDIDKLSVYINLNALKGHEVIIEQIPDYPNALVADGVDDYAKVEDLPLLDDYTVIAKRKILSELDGTYRAFAVKGETAFQGAFVFERQTMGKKYEISNFGRYNTISEIPTDITYMTPNSYNGTPITKGDGIDEDSVNIFSRFVTDQFISAVLYSFILFNRTLTNDEIEWVKTNLIEGNDDDADWYGVEFYTTSPNPDCVRIGNPELHKTLPVHTQMKGCLLADDGTVNKYLNESDWTSETRDGSQGQVMVKMPKESYWKFETDGNIERVKFSTKPLPGFQKTPQGYVSAYEASLQRSTNILCSVVNTDVDYRGGNNNAEWDDTYRSQLGIPATNINLNKFRTYARNRKAGSSEWNCMTYDMQKLLYWLFVVEYATLNTQKAFEANKDVDGYAQGGLGAGVTTLDRTKWRNFNGNAPFVPCGTTNSLGNKTGYVEFTMPFEYDASGEANYKGEYSAATAYTAGQYVSQGELLYTCKADAVAGTALTNTTYFTPVTRKVVQVPSYRGVENPFGHIWKWTDGCKCLIQSEADGGLSEFYVCDDPAAFTSSGTLNYELRGNLPRKEGYVKKLILGEDGEIMPLEVGAGSTTYFCDYFYTNIPASGVAERGVLFGGIAHYGATAGFMSARTSYAASSTLASFGSRLCFIPNNNNN